MERWIGKVAVVTGASSGIGSAIVIDLVNIGVRVVGVARRYELVEALRTEVKPEYRDNLHALKGDVSKEESVTEVFNWIQDNLGGVDILINNAGCIGATNLVDKDITETLKTIVNTNLWGTVFCVREAFQSMKKRNVNGHIVLINSVLGHGVPYFVGVFSSFNIYPPTKHAISAMTEVLRQEFLGLKTKVKITSISPGAVKTNIFNQEQMAYMESNSVPFLNSEDISQAILYALGTPPHVQEDDAVKMETMDNVCTGLFKRYWTRTHVSYL